MLLSYYALFDPPLSCFVFVHFVLLRDPYSEAVEEGQRWTDSAVEDLEKLSSSSPSSSSSAPTSTERREAAAEAAQTWDADFVRTFEAAFLSVESVIAGADRVDEMGARKPGAKVRVRDIYYLCDCRFVFFFFFWRVHVLRCSRAWVLVCL